MSVVACACPCITTHSPGVSRPGLSRMRLLTPSLPMSWSIAQRTRRRRSGAAMPWAAPMRSVSKRDALAMAPGIGALGVDHLSEGDRDIVEIILVDRRRAPARARARTIARRCRGRRARPRSRDRQRGRRRSSARSGSSQLPARAPDFGDRAVGAARHEEDVGDLREERDAREQRDRSGPTGRAASRRRPNVRRARRWHRRRDPKSAGGARCPRPACSASR